MNPTVASLQREIAQLAAMPYGQKRLAAVAAAIKMAADYKSTRTYRTAYDHYTTDEN